MAAVNCEPIFLKVQTAISAEPDKVLLFVEENIRVQQECVCEIIKAAVQASKANEDLTKQIMLTALNAAPEKAKAIEVCIAAITAERAKVTKSGKDVEDVVAQSGKDVQDVVSSGKDVVIAEPPALVATDDYRVIPPDIRGVYLIQPSAGGVFFNNPESRERISVRDRRPRVIVRRHPPVVSIPQSPSRAALVAK